MTRIVSRVAVLVLLSLLPSGAIGADRPQAPAAPASQPAAAPVPEAHTSVTPHHLTLGGAALAYTATAGTMLMTNDEDEPVALFGFTAYVKDGSDRASRPMVFAYNGGPGSASAWLHMGILGPRRTGSIDLESQYARAVPHGRERVLDPRSRRPGDDRSDRHRVLARHRQGRGQGLLGRRPGRHVGVRFHRAIPLREYGRWASPKFILGESYGGMRTGGVGFALLTRHNVALNGVILVSPYMDVAAGFAGLRID